MIDIWMAHRYEEATIRRPPKKNRALFAKEPYKRDCILRKRPTSEKETYAKSIELTFEMI